MRQGQKQTIITDKAYYLTLTIVDWMDVFTRKNHRETVIESLNYCQKEKGFILFAYCIMSNHIHMIANSNDPFLLKDTIRDFKKFTSKKIIELIQNEPESRREWMLTLFDESAKPGKRNKYYKFWQEGNHAIELFSKKFVWDKINYIHNNPVESGMVKNAHEWVYSSTSNYQEMENIIDIEELVIG